MRILRTTLVAMLAAAPALATEPSANRILDDAQDAYVHGKYKKAIELARPVTDADPPRAWRVIGAASCFLKDRAGALEAWSHVDGQAQSFLQYVCKRNGVAIP